MTNAATLLTMLKGSSLKAVKLRRFDALVRARTIAEASDYRGIQE